MSETRGKCAAWREGTLHLSDIIDMFEGKVERGGTFWLVVWIMPDCEVRVFQRVFNRYPFRRIKRQKPFKKVKCYKSQNRLVQYGKNLEDWLEGRYD